MVLEGLRGESTLRELCRREGIPPNIVSRMLNAYTIHIQIPQ